MDNRPIGVFDSGLGGLTVVRQLLKMLPGEDIVYFGDTGRVPYGTRSPETIEKYARQDCPFFAVEGRQTHHRRMRHGQFGCPACSTGASCPRHGGGGADRRRRSFRVQDGAHRDSGNSGDHPLRFFSKTNFRTSPRC